MRKLSNRRNILQILSIQSQAKRDAIEINIAYLYKNGVTTNVSQISCPSSKMFEMDFFHQRSADEQPSDFFFYDEAEVSGTRITLKHYHNLFPV